MTPGLCKGRCGGRRRGGAGGILKHEYLMNNNDNNEYAAPMRPEPWKSKARDPTAAARLGKRGAIVLTAGGEPAQYMF